jgi:hypothetical protein
MPTAASLRDLDGLQLAQILAGELPGLAPVDRPPTTQHVRQPAVPAGLLDLRGRHGAKIRPAQLVLDAGHGHEIACPVSSTSTSSPASIARCCAAIPAGPNSSTAPPIVLRYSFVPGARRGRYTASANLAATALSGLPPMLTRSIGWDKWAPNAATSCALASTACRMRPPTTTPPATRPTPSDSAGSGAAPSDRRTQLLGALAPPGQLLAAVTARLLKRGHRITHLAEQLGERRVLRVALDLLPQRRELPAADRLRVLGGLALGGLRPQTTEQRPVPRGAQVVRADRRVTVQDRLLQLHVETPAALPDGPQPLGCRSSGLESCCIHGCP